MYRRNESIHSLNAGETPNTQVKTIHWTDKKNHGNNNNDEQFVQCSEEKVLLHREEISILLPCHAMPYRAVCVCMCVSRLFL